MIFCKDNLKTLYSLLLHPVYLLKNHTRIYKCQVKGVKNNKLTLQDTWLSDTSITFNGTGNAILANDCQIHNSSIFFRGNGHCLSLEPGVLLFNIRIKIIGNNNTIHIGMCSHLGGGNIIHGGKALTISIGSHCYLAEGLDIWSTDTHSILIKGDGASCTNIPKSIHIGDRVWIGKDVAVLKGVTIGDDAVIGMKSLVTKDIPEGTLCVGIPCRPIKTGITWESKNPNNG